MIIKVEKNKKRLKKELNYFMIRKEVDEREGKNMSVCKERAWETLKKLSFERVTGTKEELKAANILKEECEKAGVEAHLEAYEIDMPEITEVSFAVTKPEYKEYHVIGIGNSGETSDQGITAPFVYIENALDVDMANVEGKICLATGRLTQKAIEKLAEQGALGYIVIHGSFYDEKEMISELRPRNARQKEDLNLPGIVMHISDAEDLVRSCPKEVKIVLKQDRKAKGTAHNVVATIEGTHPRLKKEIVTFTAHYDSVRYAPGAWDNATGSITILELLHYYQENKPARTVKFIWCGSEEIGLVGSKDYCKQHKDELKDHIFNINFDMTGVTLGYEHFCCSASEDVKHIVEYLAKMENYALNTKMDLYPSDSTSFANAGVPSCTFARLQPVGGAQIHNRHDTMDHLDPNAFMKTLNFVVKFSSQVINAPTNIIPRAFSKELLTKMEEHKKMMAEMEGKKEDKDKEKQKEDKADKSDKEEKAA